MHSLTYTETSIEGLRSITLPRFEDERGFFLEGFKKDAFAALGLFSEFVQDNQSRSKKGVVRGLHFQWSPPLAKLVRVGAGRAFLAFADIRPVSPTFKKTHTAEVPGGASTAFFVPAGVAAGFCALEDNTDIIYKYSAPYNPSGEGNIRFDDSELAIAWPVSSPILSPRDQSAPTLADWLERPESRAW